jgi:hypothetical protein
MVPSDSVSLGIPECLVALVRSLRRDGFSVATETHDEEAFGNYQAVLENRTLRVRIVRDRSIWLLQIGGDGLGDSWFGAGAWRECLEGTEMPVGPSIADGDCEYVEENWRRMVDALQTELVEATGACLHARQRERSRVDRARLRWERENAQRKSRDER